MADVSSQLRTAVTALQKRLDDAMVLAKSLDEAQKSDDAFSSVAIRARKQVISAR